MDRQQSMADVSDERQLSELTALLEVSRELGATTELLPLLRKVERAVLQVLNCDRATVFLYDKTTDELFSLVATGQETIRFDANKGIAGEALKSSSLINVTDAYADPRFNPAIDRQTGYKTRHLLTFPLIGHDGAAVGVLQALNKSVGPFDQADQERACDLGALAGVAIQRQVLLDEFTEKQKLERDLSLARDIQQRLLPKQDPQVPGYTIAGWNDPADATGGDCFDYVPLDDGRLGLLLADVTGHGIGPALIAAECRALVRAMTPLTGSIPVVAERTNHVLHDDLDSGRFVTAFVGILDPARHAVDYISAGQGPLLHYQYKSGNCIELPASTFPMGIVPEIDTTPPSPIQLEPGDMLVLVTDGFLEWADPDGEQFGAGRVAQTIHQHRNDPPRDVIDHLHQAVLDFAHGEPQADDLTAVIVRRDRQARSS